jgi:hypothetical protein
MILGDARIKWLLSGVSADKIPLESNIRCQISRFSRYIFKLRYAISFAVFFFVFIKLLFLYLFQFFFRKSILSNNISSVIIGVGRGYEVKSVIKFFEINSNNSIIVDNAFVIDNFFRCNRVGFYNLLSSALYSLGCFYSILKYKGQDELISLILEKSVKNIVAFSYFRAFFIELKKIQDNIVIYIDVAILQSLAAISVELKVINVTHGLIKLINPYIYPEYYSIYVYSEEERQYLLSLGLKSRIYVYKSSNIKHKEKSVVIFMTDLMISADVSDLKNVIKLFKLFDYKENSIEKHNWGDKLDLSNIEMIGDIDTTSVLTEKKPSFVVAWDSTALCEALKSGIIPINMKESNLDTSVMVYPIRRKTLIWPNDSSVVRKYLTGDVSSDSIVESLRTR